MSAHGRKAHLTIEHDGERVVGELRDEGGAVSAFSGWLELISALDLLATAGVMAPRVLAAHDHGTELNGGTAWEGS